ncbi:MAG TPA: DNA cytosine methyltransferase [Stellaceae bacterium]|nr:DNA cytosine methyltransferase [Stellaceae bacterium]
MPFDAAAAKTRTALVADLFCGAGGSSTGAQRALTHLGYSMVLVAVNHWDRAVETHSKNHPSARHYLQDVTTADPIKLVPEGKLDLLMASPTCVHHSRARGGKPSSDQQRMDPWAIVRWCSELRVKRLLVENVPEFCEYGPIDLRTGRPIKRRKGEYFRAWVDALRGLGFKVEWRILNAADFGDATTRIRFFLMARSDGRRIVWPEPTHSRDGIDLLGQATRKWRAAREIIDWSIEGQSIFSRKRPLARATLERIYAGAVKFRWPEPYLVVLRRHMDAQSLDLPVPALCAAGTHVGLAEPMVLRSDQTGGNGLNVRPASEPLFTITGNHGGGLAIAEPFLLNRHGENGSVRAHDVGEPMPTADCRGAGYLIEPFTLSTGSNGAPRSVEEPLPTITTGGAGNPDRPGCARPMLVEPFIAAVAHGSPPREASPDARRCRSIEDPLQTIHAGGGKFALVEPVEPDAFVLSQASGGAPRSVDDPVPAIPCGGAHALIAPYYSSGSGETCNSVDDPLPTVTTKARFGVVVPITHTNGGPAPRSVEEPLPTITTAHRGELAVIVASHGEREGQAPRVHSIDDPCPTICATGRVQLAQPSERDWDIRFRMLQPHELAAAMGFSDADREYEFQGNKTEVTRQIGNAVPVNTATALVTALMS